MMNELANRLTRNTELKVYLDQLKELIGREVFEEELGPIEEVEQLKEAASQLKDYPKKLIEIAPGDLVKERFALLVHQLTNTNPSPVSIWLNATSSCGAFSIPRVDAFNFGFRFDLIPEGVVVLFTKDGRDRLLLDFGPDEVEVELQGEEWGNIEY